MTPASLRSHRSIPLIAAALLVPAFAATAQAAQPAVGLGTASSVAVLGGQTVTNTGPSVINGDLGLSPGTAVTGFPPGLVNGAVHAADAVALQAQSDLTTAYNDAAGRTPAALVPGDLGGTFITPGVYKRSSSLLLTGDMTLDAQGDPDAVFIFQVGSALTTASSSRVLLTRGAQACNVFWQIGSSATIGTDTEFHGNILTLASITMNTRAALLGRALARNGAVTLDTNVISRATCAPGTLPGPEGPAGPPGPGGGTGPGPGGPGSNQLGNAFLGITPRGTAQTVTRYGTSRCLRRDFRAEVSGVFIRKVVFLLDGRGIGTRTGRPPFSVLIHGLEGVHLVRARITFTDGTPARSLGFAYRVCEQGAGTTPGIPGFTG